MGSRYCIACAIMEHFDNPKMYSLTDDMGMKTLEALRIMQHIGIDYLKANGMEHILEEKGVVPD